MLSGVLHLYVDCSEHESGRVRCDTHHSDKLIGEALKDTNAIGRRCMLHLMLRGGNQGDKQQLEEQSGIDVSAEHKTALKIKHTKK